MSSDGHGLPDAAAKAEGQFMHRVESEEQEHEAAAKRGITDEMAEAEHQFMHRVESDGQVDSHAMTAATQGQEVRESRTISLIPRLFTSRNANETRRFTRGEKA
jgi:hypothetical protein